jgi:cytoskeleton-associated protein 5
VQTLALDIVAHIATGMGKAFDKQCRLFVVPLCTVLADQKAPVRASALQVLTAIADACEGMEPMVPGIATALESVNPVQRLTLLGWLVDRFKDIEPPSSLDLSTWATSIVACLDDKNGDVRKGAAALLPTLVACAGYDYVMQQTNSLKPASRATAVPLIQAARASAPASAPPTAAPKSVPKATSVKTATATSPVPNEPSPASSSAAPASKATGIRRKLPQGTAPPPEARSETPVEPASSRVPSKLATGLRRPAGSISTPKPPVTAVDASMPFSGSNPDTKKARLKDAQKWINEGGTTRKDLAESLNHQMEPYASKELLALLFSRDHNAVNDHVAGLTMIHDFYTNVESGDERFGSIEHARMVCIANSDFALKYVSMKAHEPQSNLVQRCLEVVESVIAFFQSVDYQLTDSEALCFIPTIVHKVSKK